MTVKIITDSTCDLPAEVVSRLGIRVLPLYINVGSQGFLDGIDITREEFYQKLPSFHEQPTTAVPSPLKFHALYDAFADEGASEVLSIHISASLSGILSVAQVAAHETTSIPVTVFDSRQLSLRTGFLVQTAAEMAQAGRSVAEILPALKGQIQRTHTCAALDTLEFLKRSGRMNGVISSIGKMLQIKPILRMYDGKASTERVRTRKNAVRRLVALLHEFSPFEKIAFLHSGAMDDVQALRQEVSGLLPEGEIWLEQINPVLGAHIGPGVIGFVCVSKA
jgi:DegV family protein with EDD domain